MTRHERPNIAQMQGYTWGEQPEDADTIKLNTNENPYPPSPKVQQALAGIDVARLRTYPQPTADTLRDAIAQLHQLHRSNVVVTHAGDEALRLAITTFVDPGKPFGMANPSYSLYPVLAEIHDAPVVSVDLQKDWTWPTDFARQLNQAGVELTCVVNPHAPSGTLYPIAKLAELAAELDGVLLIDEAYADFVDPAVDYNSAAQLAEHENVLILRTFSKGYSLAGLRLGYLLGCTTLIDPIISKTRDSYNVDHIAQTLGLAAIADQNYAQKTWQQVRLARASLQQHLAQLGLPSPPTETNFLLVEVPEALAHNASEIYRRLKEAGILVRYFNTPGLDNRLRITVGTPAQNQRLLDALTNILT
ncbi:MAG: histidinol-phosphate transaminase [bacterium]